MNIGVFIITMAGINSVSNCEHLALQSPDESIQIMSAQSIEQSDSLPAYCQIQGTIEPSIGFEARFPRDDWNGKYFQTGCGGFCGRVLPSRETRSNSINHALRRGYATIITDGGHVGEHTGDGRWAKDNPAAEKVYAHETLPLSFTAGHQLIAAVYKAKPSYSYFSGCSNGGRLAGIAAQRYPKLFDGIVAGCSALNLSISAGVYGSWMLQANYDANGAEILDYTFVPKMPMLEANALQQCDPMDGRIDGVISDPDACNVDLSTIPSCDETTVNCLTDSERQVVAQWYQGPVNSKGQKLFDGVPPGSERYWGYWFLGTEEHPGAGTLLADGYLKYLGFPEDPDDYDATDFNFDTDIPLLASQGKLFNGLDPDLSAFQDAGGKLIMWHGMADPLVLPGQSRRYFEQVQALLGEQETHSFFRLFMTPGLGHCWEMPAGVPDQMDWLGTLEQWVEAGDAPDEVAVTQYANDGAVVRRGVLLPHPKKAEYSPPVQ